MNTRHITMYVHGGGEASGQLSELWDYAAPQQDVFHYCLYEESVGIEVDLDTGQYRYTSFAGIPLSKPSVWFGA